jgi:hypothetical protein
LRDLILEQAKVNDNVSKRFSFNDKILESINSKMDSFSSAVKDQLSFNEKIESQLAQLASVLLPATNLEKVNTITIKGGKSTRDLPYLTRTGKTPMVMQEEKKDDEVKEVTPQDQELLQDFHDTTLLPFPCKNRWAKMDE